MQFAACSAAKWQGRPLQKDMLTTFMPWFCTFRKNFEVSFCTVPTQAPGRFGCGWAVRAAADSEMKRRALGFSPLPTDVYPPACPSPNSMVRQCCKAEEQELDEKTPPFEDSLVYIFRSWVLCADFKQRPSNMSAGRMAASILPSPLLLFARLHRMQMPLQACSPTT